MASRRSERALGFLPYGEVCAEGRVPMTERRAEGSRQPYTVRVATPEDADGVTALLRRSYPSSMRPLYAPAVLAPALPLITKAQPRLLASGTYYVAAPRDGLVVGCGGWTRERPGDGTVEEGLGHLRHFGTDPEWTRRGIGKAIYARCAADARDAGIARFCCYALLNAESFYAALGFERIDTIDVALTAGIVLPGILMFRRI